MNKGYKKCVVCKKLKATAGKFIPCADCMNNKTSKLYLKVV